MRYRLLLHLSRFTEFCDISVTRSTGMEQLSQSAQVLVQRHSGRYGIYIDIMARPTSNSH